MLDAQRSLKVIMKDGVIPGGKARPDGLDDETRDTEEKLGLGDVLDDHLVRHVHYRVGGGVGGVRIHLFEARPERMFRDFRPGVSEGMAKAKA